MSIFFLPRAFEPSHVQLLLLRLPLDPSGLECTLCLLSLLLTFPVLLLHLLHLLHLQLLLLSDRLHQMLLLRSLLRELFLNYFEQPRRIHGFVRLSEQ